MPLDECWTDQTSVDDRTEVASRTPVWPWGLAVTVLLGVGGFVVAVRRLPRAHPHAGPGDARRPEPTG